MNSDKNHVRTLIVDDHPVVRRGLSHALGTFDDISVVGEAGTGEEAVRLCAVHHPDVVLMDMRMPGMDGSTATRRIKEQEPSTQVVVLTCFEEPQFVREALMAGAVGYLLKDADINELANAVRNASRGKSTWHHHAAKALIQAQPGRDELMEELTERQREVLGFVADGHSNEEIARRLHLGVSTVRYHVGEILDRLGARNRAHAAAIAIRYDLLRK
jgi:DNA-binding NarL/FixJ family response regulator